MSNRRIALVKPQDIDYQTSTTQNSRAACAGFNDYRRKHDIAVNWSTADVWLQWKKPYIRQSVSTVGGGRHLGRGSCSCDRSGSFEKRLVRRSQLKCGAIRRRRSAACPGPVLLVTRPVADRQAMRPPCDSLRRDSVPASLSQVAERDVSAILISDSASVQICRNCFLRSFSSFVANSAKHSAMSHASAF